MKRIFIQSCFILALILQTGIANCQDIPAQQQQQLEDASEGHDNVTGEEEWLQDMEVFRKHPLNLNAADEEQLLSLQVLTGLQVRSFLRYRELLGKIVSIYELQAVPYMDIPTIRKIIPFITLEERPSIAQAFGERIHNGENSILLRVSQQPERSVGYLGKRDERKYKGSPQHLFLRYRYNYQNLLQYGLTADKDAGESFFNGYNKTGFDHYSAHIFLRRAGAFRSLAIGDYTVNMGQGLIQWQSLAFSKGGDAINCKRQSDVLRPFTSSGEYYYYRGAAFTVGRKSISFTGFVSYRNLDANKVVDSITGETFISSVQTSGYHRTAAEENDRGRLRQFSWGGSFNLHKKGYRVAFNFVTHSFSIPLQRSKEPYDLFSITGRQTRNLGISYDKTFRNMHFFGETATDKNNNIATVNGILLSVDPKIDLALHYRNISRAYRTVYGNAFTESSSPGNEKGFYTGICFRPGNNWRLDMYYDLFQFPWLRYRVDAPSSGSEELLQFIYTASKQSEVTMRFRLKSKCIDVPKGNVNEVSRYRQFNWRTQFIRQLSAGITLRARVEYCSYSDQIKGRQDGFMMFSDLIYHPARSAWSGNLRLDYFDTDGFESRIYAFENDVLYNFSIPSFSGKGCRYYLNLSYDLQKNITLWLRWAQSVYSDADHIGDDNDMTTGKHKSEITLQIRCIF